MPELPEVETVRRGLDAALKGAVIERVQLRRGDLRMPFPRGFASLLAGRQIRCVARRAKYLLIHLEGEKTVIAHLGMSGRFSVQPALPNALGKHDHVVWRLRDGRAVIYNDARRFGLMDVCDTRSLAQHALLAHLGVEPLESAFNPAYLKKRLLARRAPIKPVLMDQELVVGVGNIYASEALFLAGIHPERPACDVADKAPELVSAIRQVLKAAIRSGGSSLRDFVHVSGEAGYFQHRFNVYGSRGKPCFSCGMPLRSIQQAGRSSFFCPACQK